MKLGYGSSWSRVATIWISIMSGVGSIVITVYLAFSPHPIGPKNLLLVSSYIVFVVSAAVAFWQQHSQMERLAEDNESLTAKLREQSRPSLSHFERAQLKLVTEKMALFTDDGARLIEALLRHGRINRGELNLLGLDLREEFLWQALFHGIGVQLVIEPQEVLPGGLRQYLEINPAFQDALKLYFSGERA